MKTKNLSFSYEAILWQKGYTVVGIDEVGKGALAGPVYAAAVCFTYPLRPSNRKKIERMGVNDSKQLTPAKRNAIAVQLLHTGLCMYGIGTRNAFSINREGIATATYSAMKDAVSQLRKKVSPHLPLYGIVDGYDIKCISGLQNDPVEGIVKGDSKVLSIAAASIIAKVARDEYMKSIASLYPAYGFEKHKGYGTKLHRSILQQQGPCKLHRGLFIRKCLGLY